MRAVLITAALLAAIPANANEVHSQVTSAAHRHGVPSALAHGVVKVESRYNCRLTGAAGERGIMQVKPATARSVGVTGNLYDCETGLEAGMRYLKAALARVGGDWCHAATLFNRGIGARPASSGYCRKVMAHAGRDAR